MPIYEYRCKDCSHEFETIQKVGARALRKCPECEGRLDKLISKTAFQLKGGGWFAQDYGNAKTAGGSAKTTAKKKSVKKESKDS